MVSGEKRICEGDNVLERVEAILLDIEGTTSSITFVKETLFPYVRDNLKSYIESHWNNDEFKKDLELLKSQAKKDEEEKLENFCPIEEGDNEMNSVMKNVLWQMDLDRKNTALKQLQGHIWREGYEAGKLKGHLFSDVPVMLKKWCEDGRKLYIYSSGSVEAQKLLFQNAEVENVEGFITGYFDTEIGSKTEVTSYANIASKIGFEPRQILFLTDSVKEAVAADKAGMQVTLVIRDGNAPLTDDEKKAFGTVNSFKELVFESSIKKKKMCKDEEESEKADNGKLCEEGENGSNEGENMEVEAEKTENDEGDAKEEEEEEKAEVKEGESEEIPEEKGSAVTSSGAEEAALAETKVDEAANGANEAKMDGNVGSSGETETEVAETNGKSFPSNGEAEEGEKNGTMEDHEEAVNGSGEKTEKETVAESVVIKKVVPEDHADSTVDVTA